MYQNGYQQYKMQAVNTMTKGEMLLLLYDELIKRLTRAELALEREDYEVFEASVKVRRDRPVFERHTEYRIQYQQRIAAYV